MKPRRSTYVINHFESTNLPFLEEFVTLTENRGELHFQPFFVQSANSAAEFSEAVVGNPEDAHKNEPTILFERKTRFDFAMY